MPRTALLAAALTTVLLGGCSHTIEQLPPMFVKLAAEDLGPYQFRAVSPDGVVLGLRVQKNTGDGTLEFWTEAVKNELTGRGYKLQKSDPVRGAVGAGQLLDFTTEQSGQEFTFLVAVFVKDGDILLAEAGGMTGKMKGSMDAIRKSLLTAK